MIRFFEYLIPGTHLHKQKMLFLGDVINVIASLSIISGILLYYANHANESIYLFALFLVLFVVNIWRNKYFQTKASNPAFIKLQELEFREIISNFLLNNNEVAIKNLKKMTNQVPCPHELEIFMLFLLQNQGKNDDAKKIRSYLNTQSLTSTAKSLLFSISKKLSN